MTSFGPRRIQPRVRTVPVLLGVLGGCALVDRITHDLVDGGFRDTIPVVVPATATVLARSSTLLAATAEAGPAGHRDPCRTRDGLRPFVGREIPRSSPDHRFTRRAHLLRAERRSERGNPMPILDGAV